MPHIDKPGGVLLAERLFSEAFPSGREARSEQYRDGVKAFLMYVFAAHPIKHEYKPGDPRRDAFYSGIDEGKHIARREQNARARKLNPAGRTRRDAGFRSP